MGIPPRKSSGKATVIIRVIRNKESPSFSNLPATVSLSQSAGPDFEIFTVEARDDDVNIPFNILDYSIVGDDNAPRYFDINDQGLITVKADLRAAPGDEIQYKVI